MHTEKGAVEFHRALNLKNNMSNPENQKCEDERILEDKKRIEEDKERIVREADKLARDEERLKEDERNRDHEKKKFFFKLDGAEYESLVSSINGADVRAKLPPEKAGYAIYLEGHHNEPDKQITDTEAFSLEKHILCFYSVPPATFGLV